MQKQELSPLSSLKSDGDDPAYEAEADNQPIDVSPLSASPQFRKQALSQLQKKSRRRPVQEITEQLYKWNSYLIRKFESKI